MAETSVARKSEWWPGRRMADWLDWLEHPMRDFDRVMRIEETRDDDSLTIRAELPGIDPDKDVTITLHDHSLDIRAERREETTSEEKGTHRSEFTYGSFFRRIQLPVEAKEGDVKASYKDGILEVSVPCAPQQQEANRIPVERK